MIADVSNNITVNTMNLSKLLYENVVIFFNQNQYKKSCSQVCFHIVFYIYIFSNAENYDLIYIFLEFLIANGYNNLSSNNIFS